LAELQGFRIERRTAIVLQLGQELTLDFTLRVGGVQETVTVAASGPILETAKNTVGTIITNDDIDDLPTVGRDFSSLARLAPGVTPGVGGNGDSLSMNGQRGFSNGFFSTARRRSGSTTGSSRQRWCRTGSRNSRS
jgi:hypothetical protein